MFRQGRLIAIVPECTWHDDPSLRLIVREGEAIIQWEKDDNTWHDDRSLGPVEGLTRCGVDEEGVHDVHIYSDIPLVDEKGNVYKD